MGTLLVGIGGIFGALARFMLSKYLLEKTNTLYPVGTFLVNITGAFILSLVLVMTAAHFRLGESLELLLTTGFLGSYTTFSSFSAETLQIFGKGEYRRGSLYLLGSLAGGLAAALGGITLASWLVK